jgi:hypothetical protein
MNERPRIHCPKCNSVSKKMVSACGIIVHHTGFVRAVTDHRRTEADARQDLAENYGVEKVSPTGVQSFGEIYSGIKSQGSLVKDQMQAKKETEASRVKTKQRNWAVGARRRVEKKTIDAQKRRAKANAAKRAITL